MDHITKTTLALSCLIAFCLSSVLVPPVSAKEIPNPAKEAQQEGNKQPAVKTITVLSESQVSAKAELGVVTVHFTAYGWTVDKARNKTDKLVRKFMDKLSREKIVPVQTYIGEAKLKPSYQFNRDLKESVPADFLVSRQVKLELDNLSSIGKIMDASISVGSFLLESVRLTVNDKPALAQKAFEKTLEEGKKKAEAIAQSLGSSVEGILSVEEIFSDIEEINLIQKTGFAEMAANNLPKEGRAAEEPDKNAEEPALQSGEGFLALTPTDANSENRENSPQTDKVQATSHLRITFAIR